MSKPKVAVLRPDDSRIVEAACYLQSQGVSPVTDPMLTIRPTGQAPHQADYCIFTSKTGVELAADQGWQPNGTTVCAVGQQTATALREQNYSVDIIPSTSTSRGLVEVLADKIDGQTVEIARSAHGSEVLIQGLRDVGAEVHETHLYCLERPPTAGRSIALTIEDELDGILFTSPKTVEHFVGIAHEQNNITDVRRGLRKTIVGVIGTPTERAARKHEIAADIKPDTVGFKNLTDRLVSEIISA